MKNFFILFIVMASFSCNSQTKRTDINLKDYFWQLSEYEEPKILVYDIDSIGVDSREYLLIEKVGNNKLSVIGFNKNFSETYYIVDRFTDSCVYLDKTSIVEDLSKKEKTDHNIEEGVIFWYNNFDTPISIRTSFTPSSSPGMKITIENYLELVEMTEKTFNGKALSTIIAKGNNTMTAKSLTTNQNRKEKTEIWYTEGIGITMQKRYLPTGTYTRTFVKIISNDEFNKLRGI